MLVIDDVVSVRLLDVNETLLLTDVAGSGSFLSGVLPAPVGDVTVALGGEVIGGIGRNPWTPLASANVVGERLLREATDVDGAGTTCGPLGGILGSILTSTILFWAVFSCNVGCWAKLMLNFGGEGLLSVLSETKLDFLALFCSWSAAMAAGGFLMKNVLIVSRLVLVAVVGCLSLLITISDEEVLFPEDRLPVGGDCSDGGGPVMMDFVYPSPFPLSSLVSRILTMS